MDDQWDRLATFNAERGRGLVHTPEYVERMRREQERFDWHARKEMGMEVGSPPPPEPPIFLPVETWKPSGQFVNDWWFWPSCILLAVAIWLVMHYTAGVG